MAEEKPRRVELELGLDPTPLEEGIQKAERDLEGLQQAIQRLGMAAPPLPPPPPPNVLAAVLPSSAPAPQLVTPPPVPQLVASAPAPQLVASAPAPQLVATGEGAAVYDQVRSELQRLQARLLDDPRQSWAQLERLQAVVDEQVRQHPEQRDLYRELNQAIRNLTEILKESKEKAAFQRFEQVLGVVNLGQQIMEGNMLGAAGAALGTLLGGGLGSAIGAAIGNSLQSVINAAERPLQIRGEAVDLLARFGQAGDAERLLERETGLLYQGPTYGYTASETISQLERGRSVLLTQVDETAIQMIREMQQLSRALGLTAEAVIGLQSAYVASGGQEGADERMAQIAAAAVAAGRQHQVEAYAEVVNSARVQLVNQTASPLSGDDSLIQQMMVAIMGGGSRTAGFFVNNPHLLLAGLGGVWGLGATTDWGSTQAALALQSGVRLEQLDPRFNRPEQLMENTYRVLQSSIGYLFGEQNLPDIYRQAREDPDFVERYFAAQPERQAMFSFVFGEPDAAKTQVLISLLQQMLENGGRLPDLPQNNELMRRLADYNADPVATYRETMARRADEMLKLFQNFMAIFLQIQELLTGIWSGVNTIVDMLPWSGSDPRVAEQRLRTAIAEARQAAEQGIGLGQIPVQELKVSKEVWNEIRRLGGGEGIPALEALSQGRPAQANLTLEQFVPVFERYLAAQGRPPLSPNPDLPHPELAHPPRNQQQQQQQPVSYAPTDFLVGGTDSLVARVVGYVEGTRTLDGGFTDAYHGHRDPANGATNLGSFSYQHGASTPEEADRRQLEQLRMAWQVYTATLQQYGYDPNDPRIALTFADLYTQSPVAATARNSNSFLGQIRERQPGLPITDDELLEMRKRAFRDPETGVSRHAFGEAGGDADQERRHRAVMEALRHYQAQAAQQIPTTSQPQLPPPPPPRVETPSPEMRFSPAPTLERLSLTPQSPNQLGPRMTTINVYVQSAASTTLPEQVRDAAYAGVKAAEDELDRDFARVDPGIYRNQPRYHPSLYN